MKITTKNITFISVLSAIYVVLALLSIGTNDFKVSIETLAVVTGSITIGPVGGFFVGIVGEFIHQLLSPYGIDPTTILWLLPYAFEGLIVGLIVKKDFGNIPDNKLRLSVIVGEVFLTIAVTLVNWVSAIVQGWGTWELIAAAIPLRVAIMAVRVVLYILILPFLYKNVKKVI